MVVVKLTLTYAISLMEQDKSYLSHNVGWNKRNAYWSHFHGRNKKNSGRIHSTEFAHQVVWFSGNSFWEGFTGGAFKSVAYLSLISRFWTTGSSGVLRVVNWALRSTNERRVSAVTKKISLWSRRLTPPHGGAHHFIRSRKLHGPTAVTILQQRLKTNLFYRG